MVLLARLRKVMEMLDNENKTEKELLTLYKNFNHEMGKVSDAEFQQVKDEYEGLINKFDYTFHKRFPKAAKSLYGAKDASIREQLQRVLDELKIKYDLSSSVLENRIKTGGDMIAGRSYLCVYLSYKNKQQQCVFLGAYQEKIDSALLWVVKTYTAYLHPSDEVKCFFPALELDKAQELYEEKLRNLLPIQSH